MNTVAPPPRALVFDLDGTLVDSSQDIAAAVNHALERAALPALSLERVKSFVGDGARVLMLRAADLAEHDPRAAQLLADFLDYYAAHATTFTRPMPAALDVLAQLGSRFPLALATNKPRQTTELVLNGLGLTPYFRVVVAGGDAPRPKPSPDALQFIAERLRLEPAELVMIGDGPQDVLAGRAAGARTVAVRGGMAADDRLHDAEPSAFIAALAELPAVIERWSAEK